MELQFFGAAGFVTGSCHMLRVAGKTILVDCGMFQGKESKKNYDEFRFNPKDIDAVLLTHAHLDHCGLLPKLVKEGFRGPIYATAATCDLSKVVMEDSGHIHEFENKWDNRRLKREGKPLRKPLYTAKDATKTFKFLTPIHYNQTIKVFPGITAVYRDAGHILGSAAVEVFADGKKIVFSGDIGQWNAPIIDDPKLIREADYVVVESTYGDRVHENKSEKTKLLAQHIRRIYKEGGKLLIPSFAIERTQELIYHLNELVEAGKIPHIPVFVDSPMANRATQVFMKHTENYDEEARNMLAHGDEPFKFHNLTYIKSSNESKALNGFPGPCVIIASSGMCTGGRIKHHLKHHLPHPDTTVLFIGYQAYGTLGRKIKDGAKRVRIYGDNIPVRGSIFSVGGFSGHADQPQLLKWLNGFVQKPQNIFIVHGEPQGAQGLKKAYGKGHIAKLYETVRL